MPRLYSAAPQARTSHDCPPRDNVAQRWSLGALKGVYGEDATYAATAIVSGEATRIQLLLEAHFELKTPRLAQCLGWAVGKSFIWYVSHP